MRVGILGAGSISAYHIAGLQAAGAEVAALFSRTESHAREVAARFGIPWITTRYEESLSLPALEAVVIATPDFTHEEVAAAAAQARKPSLLQKPMARTGAECRRIIAAFERAGVSLHVSWMHRYFGEVERTRQLLAEGALGSVSLVRQRNVTRGADWAAWFFSREKVGGGAVMQLGVHGIDLLRTLFGEIVAVKATIATVQRQRTLADGSVVEPDNEDLALATYRFASGTFATHEMGYCAVPVTDRFRMEIYGTWATAWLHTEHGALATNSGRGWTPLEVPPGEVGCRQHRHWLAMLRGEVAPDASAQDGLAAVEIAEAIYRSAEADGWVAPG